MGFDQPTTMGRREYGGVAALPVWMDFMKAQLKDTPSQWVSINNRSKSKKQQQEIVEMTDDGLVAGDDDVDNSSKAAKPVKTQTQQRQAPAPKPPETVKNSEPQVSGNKRSDDSVPLNPLSVTPVDRMPPLPV